MTIPAAVITQAVVIIPEEETTLAVVTTPEEETTLAVVTIPEAAVAPIPMIPRMMKTDVAGFALNDK